jgi:hypothetical protein
MRHLFVALLLMAALACSAPSEGRGTLEQTGLWELPGKAVIFYAIEQDLPEASLKQEALALGKPWQDKYGEAIIYLIYDGKFAKEIASPKILEKVAQGAMGFGDQQVLYGGKKVWGGARLTLSPNQPDGDWVFEPKRVVAKP